MMCIAFAIHEVFHKNRHNASVAGTARTWASQREILRPGKTLSVYVEDSLRWTQLKFSARGSASGNVARISGAYFSSGEVLQGLDNILAGTKIKAH
jgi:hypothetical protein